MAPPWSEPAPVTPAQRAIGLALASSLLGSLGAAASKHVAPQSGIATLIAAQYLICTVLLAPQCRRHLTLRLPAGTWLWHAVRGVSGFLCFLFFYMALQHIPLADGVLLRNAAPLWVPLLGLGLGISLQRQALLPVAIGLAGIVLLVQPGRQGISHWHLVGCLSGLAFAVAMHATRVLALREPQARILLLYFLVSLACALPWAILHWRPVPATAWVWLAVVGLCLFGSLRLFTHAYSLAPAQQLAPIAYASVLFAGLLDWGLWGHRPDGLALAGMGLVIASGVVLALQARPAPAAVQSAGKA